MSGKTPIIYPRLSPNKVGIRCRCPRCGQGKLYQGLLTVTSHCANCNLDLSPHDTGDGASVFVIFILGGLVVPIVLWLELVFALSFLIHFLILLPVIFVMGIILLRLVKAILIAYHFQNLRYKYED